jgi:hypothetical protein
MVDLNVVSWVMTALSLAGKGFICQIPHKWRLIGFLLLAATGVYWTYELLIIDQIQMGLLQMMYSILNGWGAFNAAREIYYNRKVSKNG